MKKIIIIAVAIILTTGVTTFALTNRTANVEQIKVENTNAKVTTQSANAVLATAD